MVYVNLVFGAWTLRDQTHKALWVGTTLSTIAHQMRHSQVLPRYSHSSAGAYEWWCVGKHANARGSGGHAPPEKKTRCSEIAIFVNLYLDLMPLEYTMPECFWSAARTMLHGSRSLVVTC